MVSALKDNLVPFLRSRGFKGSFPHFRREALPRVDYVTVQFNKDGGSFVVELATSDRDGRPSGYGSELPLAKLTTHFFRDRYRLGSTHASGHRDYWFSFGPSMLDVQTPLREKSFYAEIAAEVRAYFERDGEAWYESRYRAA